MKSKKTEVLWHYTSIQNAISILTNREIWATKNDFLNDRYDIDTPLKHFLKYIKEKKYSNALDKTSFESLQSAATEKYIAAFYILSLSAQGDSLPMWQAYAPMGGCAIGFKKMALFDFFNSHDGNENLFSYYPLLNGLYKVRYTTMNGHYALKEIDKEIDTWYEQYGCIDSTKKIGRTYKALELCVAPKDKSFIFEEEYRFVFLSKFDKIADNIFFNNGKPFIKIQLPPISSCVANIILSPHETNDLTIRAFNFIKELISFKEKQDCDFCIKPSRHCQYRRPKV